MALRLRRGSFLTFFLLAAACGGSKVVVPPPPVQLPAPPADPLPIEVTVTGDERLNPDDAGRSLPTGIRLYQLRSAAKMERAEFDKVFRQPREVLGEDLLQVDELVLTPGATVRRRLDRDKASRVLAVVAVVRKPTGGTWRAVVELPPPAERAEMGFVVEGYRVARR